MGGLSSVSSMASMASMASITSQTSQTKTINILEMKKAISIIFPHQLFKESPLFSCDCTFYLIEEHLFFQQYKFHKQKIAFHRASMKCYEQYLLKKGIEVEYIDSQNPLSDIRNFNQEIARLGINDISIIDPVDYWLEKRIRAVAEDLTLTVFDNPSFLNTKEDLSSFFRSDKKSFFQTTFYKQQRKKRAILIDAEGKPEGGKWTYDVDNRKKYPKGKTPPAIRFPEACEFWREAVEYTETHFADHLGEVSANPLYPISHEKAEEWFLQFLEFRFFDFGIYEDAIVQNQAFLNHSALSPLMNAGLITPDRIVNGSLQFAKKSDIPLNSLEGFIRQIIGWREFIRGMYECKGRFSRTQNFWKFKRKIPASFYDGTTGIEPIDIVIKRTLKLGYCHHIERLMVLGNFMLLCEIDPNEVYRWFMELFIDAYDWVMVPNVYSMSQFADGGTFATKPYIGGSNYLRKMSDFPRGDWEQVWDGLFWRFIHEHQDFFQSNPRTSMLLHSYRRMTDEKRDLHLKNAEEFLSALFDTETGKTAS